MILCGLCLALLLNDTLIDQLVMDLGADEFARREWATNTLDHLGALAYLKVYKVRNSQDIEVRRRANEVIGRIQPRLLDRAAAERHVEIRGTKWRFLAYGTVLRADGSHALVLTTTSIAAFSNSEVFVNWGSESYPASIEIKAADADLTLLLIRCKRRVTSLSLASGRTKGIWCDHKFDMDGMFRVEKGGWTRGKNHGCGDYDCPGAGIFALDEATGNAMLAGVNIGPLPGHEMVVDARSPQGRVVDGTCGVEPVRRLMEQWEEKTNKERGR